MNIFHAYPPHYYMISITVNHHPLHHHRHKDVNYNDQFSLVSLMSFTVITSINTSNVSMVLWYLYLPSSHYITYVVVRLNSSARTSYQVLKTRDSDVDPTNLLVSTLPKQMTSNF